MDEIYWVRLALALGEGAKLNSLIDFFGSPKELFDSSKIDLYLCPFLTPLQASKITESSERDAEEVIKLCRKNGWSIITPDSSEYPKRLRSINSYPLTLYIWGELPPVEELPTISVVGTRHAFDNSVKAAFDISYELASKGTVIVSGGALGIDSAAHKGALSARGKTISILGNGLGYDYLRENKLLREMISHSGAVISESPPFTPPTKHSFPLRNRLISAFGTATLVIQAGIKSGSLLTAQFAYEQGRKLFALKSDVSKERYGFAGSDRLIEQGRAIAITSASDILDEMRTLFKYEEQEEPENNIKSLEDALNSAIGAETENAEKEDYQVCDLPGEVKLSDAYASYGRGVIRPCRRKPELEGIESSLYELLTAEPKDINELSVALGQSIATLVQPLLSLQLKSLVDIKYGSVYYIV